MTTDIWVTKQIQSNLPQGRCFPAEIRRSLSNLVLFWATEFVTKPGRVSLR